MTGLTVNDNETGDPGRVADETHHEKGGK